MADGRRHCGAVLSDPTHANRDPNVVFGGLIFGIPANVILVSLVRSLFHISRMDERHKDVPDCGSNDHGDCDTFRLTLCIWPYAQSESLAGSESNQAVFETGASLGTANLRIKGSKRFVDKIITQAESITGSSASLTRLTLVSETITYSGFQEGHVAVLEKELAKTMTSVGRSESSFNDVVTIKCAFEKGLHEVRFKYSGKNASLNITIVGDQEFIDRIKSLLNKTMNPED